MIVNLFRAPDAGALLTTPGIIAITGGGGKTSLLHALLASLKARGVFAVGATTVRTYLQDSHDKDLVFVHSAADCRRAAVQAGISKKPVVLCSGIDPANPAKALGVDPEWLDQVSRELPDCLFIVEADGSAGKSIKGHLPHEPVIPQASKLIIPVVGLDVVGKPVDNKHVHRAERLCELIGDGESKIITPELIARLLSHPEGYRHNVPAQARTILLLNKAEGCSRLKSGLAICRALSKQPDQGNMPCAVVIGSIQRNNYTVRKLKH